MANIVHLRIVNKNNIDESTHMIFVQDSQEKQKNRRGRPRKTLNDEEKMPTASVSAPSVIETVIIPRKRGRKRKDETLAQGDNTPIEEAPTKSYIVQLKIKSSDLTKIQTQFINNSQAIGYTHQPRQITDLFTSQSTSSDLNDYFNLLNKLELPLVPTSEKDNMPMVPSIYKNIVIPILPENVPIKLFDGNQQYSSSNDDLCETLRDTGNLLLPLLDNKGAWPEKSPYACWNCDYHFNGTPWGIPDTQKEPINDKFYGYGNFCSAECTARYLSDRENSMYFWEKYSILCLIYQRVFNLPPEVKVPIAPPRETLAKYGGKFSYDSYHNASKNGLLVEVYKLPMVPVRLHIGEIARSSSIDILIQKNQHSGSCSRHQKRIIPIDPVKMTQAEENVKQKNTILLQNKYTLDTCLGGNRFPPVLQTVVPLFGTEID